MVVSPPAESLFVPANCHPASPKTHVNCQSRSWITLNIETVDMFVTESYIKQRCVVNA